MFTTFSDRLLFSAVESSAVQGSGLLRSWGPCTLQHLLVLHLDRRVHLKRSGFTGLPEQKSIGQLVRCSNLEKFWSSSLTARDRSSPKPTTRPIDLNNPRVPLRIPPLAMSLSCRYAAQCCARQIRSTSSLRTTGALAQQRITRRYQSTDAAAPTNPKIATIVDQISQLTLLETADLVSSLKVGNDDVFKTYTLS